MTDDRIEAMDFASYQKIVPKITDDGPVGSSFQVYNEEEKYR
jgi:hypothetical protein